MTRQSVSIGPKTWTLLAAFAAVYFIWGSTYIAILIVIETVPPFIMLGLRFGVAGLLMLGWLLFRGVAQPTQRQWLNAVLVGVLLLGVGTGNMAWALQYIPSGIAALLVTTVPMWMILLDWAGRGGQRPSGFTIGGLLVGIIGVILLFDPVSILSTQHIDLFAALAVLGGAFAWAAGSVYARGADLPTNPFMSTALQMTTGGLALLIVGLLRGEGQYVTMGTVSLPSILAWGYLLIFGSLVAFSAYVWLLKNTTPAKASTYAYVNPVVAVLLGWLMADEVLDLHILLAMVFLISAVVLITRTRRRRPPSTNTPSETTSERRTFLPRPTLRPKAKSL